MELKAYLRILLRRWWIVLPTFLITLTAAIVFTFSRLPVYSSTATFVVRPNTAFGDVKSFVSGLEILSRRTEIATTYSQVASSRVIKEQATEELGLSREQKKDLSVVSQLLAGTNVIEITVEAHDPEVARDLASMVGLKTVAYLQDLYEAYDLKPLDEAALPSSPIAPNRKLSLALGAVLGLVLGGGLAFLSEYLQTPLENLAHYDIFDHESGVYNSRYFRQRLGEEMSRSRHNRYALSLALMNVDHLGVISTSFSPEARNEALRKVAVFLKQYLREEDVVARLDGTVFAFLLPDMPAEQAKAAMEKLQTRVAWTPFEIERNSVKLNLSSAAGVTAYQYNGTGQDELMSEVSRALQQAETTGQGKVCVLPEDGEHD
jgi:diguanylate cyclase (GGDEF)-like protein